MLVQDDEDIAYQPTDSEGKKIATALTMYLRRAMWRAKMRVPDQFYHSPYYLPNCRCVIRPIDPDK